MSALELPPSYEEVMGKDEVPAPQYTEPKPGGSTHGPAPQYSEPTPGGSNQYTAQGPVTITQSGPGLMFVDFLPCCTRSGNKTRQIQPAFENFKHTSTYLNQWLASNPGYRVASLEEVTRPVNWDGSYMLDTSISINIAGINLYIRGLRVWVRPRTATETGPVQVINYFNYIPPYVPKNAGEGAFSFQLPMVRASIDLFDRSGSYLNLDNTLQVLNSQLASQPPPGQVIAINSVRLSLGKVDRLSEVRVSEDMADETLISSKGQGTGFFTFLRVYYVCGVPQPTEIGIVDFVPQMTSRGSGVSIKPQFEPFDMLSHRAGQWIHDNDSDSQGLRVINLQTMMHTMDLAHNLQPENIKTRETATYLSYASRLELRFLRVSFLRQRMPNLRPLYLTTKTFVPVVLDHKAAETGAQTLHRINAWLQATGVSVFGVDTLTENYSTYTSRCDPSTTASFSSAKGSQHSMKVIRLYLNGTYVEPQLMPATTAKEVWQPSKGKSSSCSVM